MVAKNTNKGWGAKGWDTNIRESWGKEHLDKQAEEEDVLQRGAITVGMIEALRYKRGQRMRITVYRQDDNLNKAPAVVVQDCDRVVVVDVVNDFKQKVRMQILKADIIRGHVSDKNQRGGRLKIELLN